MSRATLKAIQAAAGNAVGATYVDDVFSTYLYKGNGSSQTITNGIDLNGEGGLTWFKARDDATFHILMDTERGGEKWLRSDSNIAEGNASGGWITYNSDGFTLPQGINGLNNTQSMVSWTFRKQPGFFDVVTYTGNGVAGRTVSHNLGSTPAFIMVKRLDAADEWTCYVGSLGATKWISLNQTAAAYTSSSRWNDTAPTDSVFTVGTDTSVNRNTSTYVAYLFAHDAQDFGTDSDESIIKCGSYTGNGSTDGPEIDLGFEPQWLLIKNATASSNWMMVDNMRGLPVGGDDETLAADSSNAENNVIGNVNAINILPNGWKNVGSITASNSNGNTHIYIAIRRPHKPASEFAATDLFEAFEDRTSIANQINGTMGPVDVTMQTQVPTAFLTYHFAIFDRLRGQKFVSTSSTAAESGASVLFDTNEGVENEGVFTNGGLGYNFKRAPGFFDVVAYTGDGTGAKSFNHNLRVIPELMIVKGRNYVDSWYVYVGSLGASNRLKLDTNGASGSAGTLWNTTSPTATQFTVGSGLNASSETNIVYLFASVDGISKVGSYTGTGSNVDINCGFTSGARFVLVKRTDSTGDWYVWDYVRGIVAGNDPYLLFNSTATEVTSTDYIDPLSSGFTITSSAPAALNASGGTYIFLAIA